MPYVICLSPYYLTFYLTIKKRYTIVAKELITFQFKLQVGHLPFVKWFFNYRHIFSNLYILVCAGETFGTSTSSCEASFSTIERLITLFIKALGHNRKCALVHLSFERKFRQTIDIEEYIKEFKKKNRRINLYILYNQ